MSVLDRGFGRKLASEIEVVEARVASVGGEINRAVVAVGDHERVAVQVREPWRVKSQDVV